jgi:Sulfatase
LPPPTPPTPRPLTTQVVVAVAVWGVTNLVVAALFTRSPIGLARVAYELGHACLFGVVAFVVIALVRRLGRRWGIAAASLLCLGLGLALLPPDLESFVGRTLGERVGDGWVGSLSYGIASVMSLGPVVATVLALALLRFRLELMLLVWGLGAQVVNHRVLQDGYPGAHLFLTMVAFPWLVIGLGWLPARLRVSRPISRRIAHAMVIVPSLLMLVAPPRDSLLIHMLKAEGSVLAPYVWLQQPWEDDVVAVPAEYQAWLEPRDDRPARPPTEPRLLPTRGIVLLVTIDSLRADHLADESHDAIIPTLARWRDTSINFTQARTPGAQTVVTLASLFSGTYYSQQFWTRGLRSHLWPHQDDTVRFTELLSDAGVATVTQASTRWLVNEHGVVRGFGTQAHLAGPKGWYTRADKMVPAFARMIARNRRGPLFGFAHLLDAHYTVRPQGKDKPDLERFWLNMATVDRQLAELERFVTDQGIAGRTIIIVSADHGEGFGDHDTRRHSSTLYDELLRVPLLVRVPGRTPRRVDQPVSLVDLGPTILDLFGQPIPSHFMGESLVPLLRGRPVELTRPIVAEGRLKRAMVFPDGHKLIYDTRYRTRELFDLRSDPGELHNLVDDDPHRARPYLAALAAFFDAHGIQQDGYSVPYRR